MDEVRESSLLVDDGSLVVHLRQATVLLRQDGACTPLDPESIRVGDRVGHNAEEVLLSYPAQVHPTVVVVEAMGQA
ncbi:MAG: hypothetical protein ACPGQL_10985 [Thermoplasmatota archaeon]